MIIRHFTDTPEQKRERSQVREGASRQVKAAEERSIKAADYAAVRHNIAWDHYRATGVTPDKVVPELNTKEIAELREYAEKLSPYSSDRRDFERGAREAEWVLQQREQAAMREAERARAQDAASRAREQSTSQDRASRDRSDRDSYTRGR
jgi:hypothetical protein